MAAAAGLWPSGGRGAADGSRWRRQGEPTLVGRTRLWRALAHRRVGRCLVLLLDLQASAGGRERGRVGRRTRRDGQRQRCRRRREAARRRRGHGGQPARSARGARRSDTRRAPRRSGERGSGHVGAPDRGEPGARRELRGGRRVLQVDAREVGRRRADRSVRSDEGRARGRVRPGARDLPEDGADRRRGVPVTPPDPAHASTPASGPHVGSIPSPVASICPNACSTDVCSLCALSTLGRLSSRPL